MFNYKLVSKIVETDAVKIVKVAIRTIGHRHPRSSSLLHVDTGPTISISGTLPGSPFQSVSSILCDSACIASMVSNQHPFNFNSIFGNRKKSQGAKSGEYGGWGMTAILFFSSVFSVGMYICSVLQVEENENLKRELAAVNAELEAV